MEDDDNRPSSKKDIATSWNQYLRQRVQDKSSQLSLSPSRSDRQVAERRADSDTPSAEEPRESSPGLAERTHTSSLKREGSRCRSASPPKRSKARPPSAPPVDGSRGFSRGPVKAKGKLWNPVDPCAPPQLAADDRSSVGTNHRLRLPCGDGPVSDARPPRAIREPGSRPVEEEDSTHAIKQPETRPISQEQLVAEVKGIYAGLVMVENKCIEVDNAQNAWASNRDAASSTKLNNEQWQALIALHRTLLHEHHDFFLASQHPSASPALRRLASKYAMPARMWRHGIHSFLELLRHRLPASLDHMLTLIYLAYSMMALLYQTVPAFEDTWIECLGDLGRYRMALEDDELRDREVWTRVSRGWYSKAVDKAPATGRLYHHLAILARPNMLQQLFYYNKSLCAAIPFQCARESIMALFDPCLRTTADLDIDAERDDFINTLDNHIGRSTRRFLEPGYYMGIANCCAITGYSQDNNPIHNAIKEATNIGKQQDEPLPGGDIDEEALKDLAIALRLGRGTHDVVFRRFGDPNILPYVHTTLAFIYHLTFYSDAMVHLALLDSCQSYSPTRPTEHDFPRPLPEEYAMRGLLWDEKYCPSVWIWSDTKVEDDTKVSGAAAHGQKQRTPWTSSATSTKLFLGHPGGQLHAQETGVYRPPCRQRCRSSLGQCHHGHIRRARLSDASSLEKRALQSALNTPSPKTPGPTYSSEPKRHTFGNLRVGPLLRLLRFFIPFYMVSVSLALTTSLPRVPWHASKVFLLAASAMGSFGTGMMSLNLDMASPSGGTRPADMSLRVVSSLLVGVLFVGYVFWFLGQRTKRALLKRAQFKKGTSLVIGLWVIVRLLRAASSSDGAERNGSHYLWLDELNILACASVVAGIANAERSIFSSAEGEGEDSNGEDGPREGRRDDIEGNINGRRVGDGGNGSSAGPDVTGSVSTALQAVAVNLQAVAVN